MKKTKIEQRFENAVNAFFENEDLTENNSLTFAENTNISYETTSKSFTEKANTLISILKQVFIFFPGTFVLFMISFAFTVISINNPFNATIQPDKLVLLPFLFLGSFFMTWFGIGDLRKPKHFIIPVSVMAAGIAIGALSGILSNLSHYIQTIVWSNAYPIYFVSIALIIPFLAKGWADRTDEPAE